MHTYINACAYIPYIHANLHERVHASMRSSKSHVTHMHEFVPHMNQACLAHK